MERLQKGISPLFLVLCCVSSAGHAFELVNKHFYGSQNNSNKIDEYDSTGKFIDSLSLADVQDIRGMAFGPDRMLYAVTTQPGNFLAYAVVVIDSLGAVKSTYLGQDGLNTNIVYGKIAFAKDGQFFVMGPLGLAAFTPGETTSTLLPNSQGFDVVGLPNGNLIFTTGNDIRELTTSGVSVRTITPSVRLDHATSIEYDPTSNQIFVTDLGQLAIQLKRLDGSTGFVNAQTSFNDGTDIVITADGGLAIASRFDAPSIFDLNLNLIGVFNHGVEGFLAQAQFPDAPPPVRAPLGIWTIVLITFLIPMTTPLHGRIPKKRGVAD